ncbi:hypothetical protein Y1Q_0014514 [Alligator mississippiensis]|uniref:Uncharacterized protein n=1 Tax=Alligator mississippiensis TaxID=8496 RepID=A0A151PCY9_ALLMI|nr:hypothetical protein Y1Q_0014514 [Alligator mississippiensis]
MRVWKLLEKRKSSKEPTQCKNQRNNQVLHKQMEKPLPCLRPSRFCDSISLSGLYHRTVASSTYMTWMRVT